jgi:hypothetical protein
MLLKLINYTKKLFSPVFIDIGNGGVLKLKDILSVRNYTEKQDTNNPNEFSINITLKNDQVILKFTTLTASIEYTNFLKKHLNYQPYFDLNVDELKTGFTENDSCTEGDINDNLTSHDMSYRIIEGLEKPSVTIGRIGDFYYDTSTSIKYGPKTELGWGNGQKASIFQDPQGLIQPLPHPQKNEATSQKDELKSFFKNFL